MICRKADDHSAAIACGSQHREGWPISSLQQDVIVMGAGVAVLLAGDFEQRVLVLERAPFIGGRTLSFADSSAHGEGLFFAGDQYGKRLWGGVDAVQRYNIEEQITPARHRGLRAAA